MSEVVCAALQSFGGSRDSSCESRAAASGTSIAIGANVNVNVNVNVTRSINTTT
jgi:hypothetical protein